MGLKMVSFLFGLPVEIIAQDTHALSRPKSYYIAHIAIVYVMRMAAIPHLHRIGTESAFRALGKADGFSVGFPNTYPVSLALY